VWIIKDWTVTEAYLLPCTPAPGRLGGRSGGARPGHGRAHVSGGELSGRSEVCGVRAHREPDILAWPWPVGMEPGRSVRPGHPTAARPRRRVCCARPGLACRSQSASGDCLSFLLLAVHRQQCRPGSARSLLLPRAGTVRAPSLLIGPAGWCFLLIQTPMDGGNHVCVLFCFFIFIFCGLALLYVLSSVASNPAS
jgi:hypothetical protein